MTGIYIIRQDSMPIEDQVEKINTLSATIVEEILIEFEDGKLPENIVQNTAKTWANKQEKSQASVFQ